MPATVAVESARFVPSGMRSILRPAAVLATVAGLLVGLAPAVSTASAAGSAAGCEPADLALRSPYLDPNGEAALAAAIAMSAEALGGVRQRDESPGVSGTYLVSVPGDLDAPAPLLVALHGLGGHGPQFAADSEWPALAADLGWIVAFPTGQARRWDATEGSPDVRFVRDLIAEIAADGCVDFQRIWVTGHSYGGFMAQRLACDAGEVIAAAAVVSGGNPTLPGVGGPCRGDAGGHDSYEPVPIAFWHGDDDGVVPYTQGRRGFDLWTRRYGCAETAVTSSAAVTREVRSDCTRPDTGERVAATGSPFTLRFTTFHDHGHGYPDGCGGLGAVVGRGTCEPDSDRWPTAQSVGREIAEFLADAPRATPGTVGSAGPAPVPAGPDPAGVAPWLLDDTLGANTSGS